MNRQSEFDSWIIDGHAKQPFERRWNEQIAFDMPKAPDEDLESMLVRGRVGNFVLGCVVVPIEYDQTSQPHSGSASLAEVLQRARGTTTAKNNRIILDATRESGLCTPRPAAKDLAIAGSLHIKDEIIVRTTT